MADCGLLNLASCLPQAFFNYIASIINAPVQPLLSLNQNLLSINVDLSPFSSLWAIMIYILSMFYALLILYSGFQFMTSGYDAVKRENAKSWLRNVVIMIILVQASFFIYSLVVGLSSSLTSATMTLVNNNFFYLTANSITNIGLEIPLFSVYLLTLLLTALLLIIRYGVVAVGVLLFPLGIFFYFVPPLRSYGMMLLNFVGIACFVTFFDAILLVGFSMLVNISFFSNVQIFVMIAAFTLVNIMMFMLMFFSIIKSAFNVGSKTATVIAKFA